MPEPSQSFSIQLLNGKTIQLKDYLGHPILIVNTASQCGFTPQLSELETLYQAYKEKGLIIIGFPCNQFGKQEPLEGDGIAQFCVKNHGVSFLISQKVEVNGPNADPLWVWLKSQKSGILGSRAIKWNFTKFLIAPDGKVVKRFSPLCKPKQMTAYLDRL